MLAHARSDVRKGIVCEPLAARGPVRRRYGTEAWQTSPSVGARKGVCIPQLVVAYASLAPAGQEARSTGSDRRAQGP